MIGIRMSESREWTIPRIEALRWRALRRLVDKVLPAYEDAIKQVCDLGGAYHQYDADDRMYKLTPVRPGGTRVAWSVRKVRPRQAKPNAPALVHLATIPLPTKEELVVGANYAKMAAWRRAYFVHLKRINRWLYDAIDDAGLMPKHGEEGSKILRINDRLYPVSRAWLNIHDDAHRWWPHYPNYIGIIDVRE
jgi:hypothetical protein